MIALPRATPRQMDPGIIWASTGGPTGSDLGDIFGHRTFSGHSSGVDFHRGIDTLDNLSPQLIVAPITGRVIRLNYSMFNWARPEQFDQLTVVNGAIASYALTGSPAVLRITGVNAGTQTFPANIGRFEMNQLFNVGNGTSENWSIQMKFNTLPVTPSGQPVFGIYQAANDEYAAIWYDGTNFVVKGKDAGGVFGVDGTTGAPAGKTWLRIQYVSSSTSVVFKMSSDGLTWTTIATEAAIAWTNKNVNFKAFVGFNPAAAGANDTADVAIFECVDANAVGRFGNQITLGTATGRWWSMHHDHILVQEGDYVYAGAPMAYTGDTGYDDTSGRILQVHLHQEYTPGNTVIYTNNESLNPLGAGLMPRCDTISIAVTRSQVNDPAGNAAHKLSIVVQRSPCQRFDINQFSLTGSTTTKVLNWNTRAGLDPADNDAVYYDGIYFEPLAFDEDDTEYTVNYYWRKSVVGNTFVSAFIKDAAGVTLWSE